MYILPVSEQKYQQQLKIIITNHQHKFYKIWYIDKFLKESNESEFRRIDLKYVAEEQMY